MTFEFDTRDYVLAHGRQSVGYGGWAFKIDGQEIIWAPDSTYGAAKRWLRIETRKKAPSDYKGHVQVQVCT